jgi:MoCo/4Fe-4S cofactor protein with predicted Tat translocation signal
MRDRVQSTELGAQGAQQQMAENANELVQIEPKKLTLEQVREKLAGQKGRKYSTPAGKPAGAPRYWRSIDELAEAPEFAELVAKEFPSRASEWIDPVSRRSFLKVMGASMALAGLAGCTKQPDEPIYPYVKAPEDLILGRPVYFASAFPFTTGAVPVLIKSDAYRPIKVDGNPEHPFNRGGSDPITQATLLDMYDPDRSQRVMYRGDQRPWGAFLAAYRSMLADKKPSGGQGLYFLSATVTSPTLARQWQEAQKIYPQAKFVQFDPVNRDNHYAAARAVFGEFVDAQYHLDQADVIVSLDADFLGGAQFPGFHRLAKDYAQKRKLDGTQEMNRLYVVESVTTTTGFKAEHRLGVRPSDVPAFAAALAGAVSAGAPMGKPAASPHAKPGELGAFAESVSGRFNVPAGFSDHQQKYLLGVIMDLLANGGKSVVIPGEFAPPSVHAAAFAINQALGNVGKTVVYTDPVNPMPSIQTDDLKALVADMNAGKVDWLVILNANPVYATPADVDFENALNKVGTIAHLGAHQDETGELAHWHVNNQHYLEMWSDARACDGTVSVVQPMIDPLYSGHSAHEIIQSMLDNPDVSPYDAVRATWKDQLSKGDFEFNWRKVLHDGWIDETKFNAKSVTAKAAAPSAPAAAAADAIEVVFRPDANVYDGRYANVGWMQEIPRPVTNLSWDNAVQMSFATMQKFGLAEDDAVEVSVAGKKIIGGALAVPGQTDNVVVVTLGQGRRTGRVAGGIGYNAYLLQQSGAPWAQTGASLRKTGDIYDLCVTKSHHIDQRAVFAGGDGSGTHSLEGNEAIDRGIIRFATLEEYKAHPGFANEGYGHVTLEPDDSMFPAYRYDKNAWGMSIDLNSCVGCNACVASCYAENNIPVVGRLQAKIGRTMQWIRIDTYFEGDLAAPRAHFQPMTCHQCENAPCEQVCPVGATVHSPEGLNMMIYNRCVGTRYCSNNCPYKVRRFNFLLYSDVYAWDDPTIALMRNPDVSVRSRGVMEKCSYCVQRIEAVKIEADKENREIRDGEIKTACQQACPTDAIVFGNINDRNSQVAKIKTNDRTYGVLADINTRPRTTYVAGVLNINEGLAKELGEYAS